MHAAIKGDFDGGASRRHSRPDHDFLRRFVVCEARFEDALPAALAFGFPEKTRSQPDANFLEVPVCTV
ncbi:MAG: hypothetical protein U0992_14030 [Planctomycetaceae bacterium]